MTGLLKRSEKENLPLEIIYLKRNGEFIHRVIVVKKIHPTHIQAFCLEKHQFRTFKIERILSALPYQSRKSHNVI
jgi:predicted DNA-binding transcriptional regulator YafY